MSHGRYDLRSLYFKDHMINHNWIADLLIRAHNKIPIDKLTARKGDDYSI